MKTLKNIYPVILIISFAILHLYCGKKSITEITSEPPVASFTVLPAMGDTTTIFHFDASACSDLEDPVESLEVRWDWDGDGVWDTDYLKNKLATRQFDQHGSKSVILEVKDSDGLTSLTNHLIEIFGPHDGMVNIPSGEFTMGSNSGEPDEQPVHKVYLDAYYIDKFEVTNDQFAAYLNEALLKGEIQASSNTVTQDNIELLDLDDPDCQIAFSGGRFLVRSGRERHPVVEVSWHGADAYARRYGKQLPTEAQWEKAARGVDERTYPWGNQNPTTWYCNYDRNNVTGDPSSHDYTISVSSHSPQGDSPYGCADMAGNVWEWCHDLYDSDYYQNSPTNNPTGPSSGANLHVIRGGAWYNNANFIRSTVRQRGDFVSTGFRCVR